MTIERESARWRLCDRPVRSLAIVALVVLVAIIGLSVCRTPLRADAAPPKPSLLVIGDSIVLGTQGNVAADLPDWTVTMDAAVSRSTAGGLDALAAHGTDYDVVVVALGANDGGTPSVFTPRVAALLDALGAVPHVIWLTIHEARPYYAQTNAIIRSQVATHPNAVVADWNAAIRPGDTGGDGLHLTPQGSVSMANWIAGAVRFVTAPPPTTTAAATPTATSTSAPMAGTISTGSVSAGTPSEPARNSSGHRSNESGGRWAALAALALVGALGVTARRGFGHRRPKHSDPKDQAGRGGSGPQRPS